LHVDFSETPYQSESRMNKKTFDQIVSPSAVKNIDVKRVDLE